MDREQFDRLETSTDVIEKLKKNTQEDLRKYKAGECTLAGFYENVIMSCGMAIVRLSGYYHERIYQILFNDCVNKALEESEND